MYVIRYLALSTVYSRGAVFHDSQVVADCFVAELHSKRAAHNYKEVDSFGLKLWFKLWTFWNQHIISLSLLFSPLFLLSFPFFNSAPPAYSTSPYNLWGRYPICRREKDHCGLVKVGYRGLHYRGCVIGAALSGLRYRGCVIGAALGSRRVGQPTAEIPSQEVLGFRSWLIHHWIALDE